MQFGKPPFSLPRSLPGMASDRDDPGRIRQDVSFGKLIPWSPEQNPDESASPRPSAFSPEDLPLTAPARPELPEWLRQLYPFRTRRLRFGSYAMSFVDEAPPQPGKQKFPPPGGRAAPEISGAPVCVLLHGSPAWSFLYRHLIPRLQPQFRVVAPDFIGFGLSDKPEAEEYHTLARHIANLTTLIERLALRDVTLVMHGWGGCIGLGYAAAHPQNVARLVLANAWAPNLPRGLRRKPPLGMRLAGWSRSGRLLDSWLNLSLHSAFGASCRRALPPGAFAGYCYPFRHSASRVGISAFLRMGYAPDRETAATLETIGAGLGKIDAPVEILCGAGDPLVSKLSAYLLRDSLPRAREPVFLPNVSHCLPEEAPEALAEIVLRTLEAQTEETGSELFRILA